MDYNRYLLGKIYQITCKTTGLCYIGSTIEKRLGIRLSKHLYDYKRYLAGNFPYVSSFKIIETDNYEISLIENYPCKNINELRQRERYYIENLPCVNKRIPNRTCKEIITCECGRKIQFKNRNKHTKGKFHTDFVANSVSVNSNESKGEIS